MDINKLNEALTNRIGNNLMDSRETLRSYDSKYPEVVEVKHSLLDFNLEEFENNTFNLLKNKLLGEWKKYQSNDEVDYYDMIYFEYHEQSFEFPDAMSYGIFDMTNFNMTIESHDFGYDHKFGYWEAGLGIKLDPFLLTAPMSYRVLSDQNYADLINYRDPKSGSRQIWDHINNICSHAFNKAFARADQENLFEDIKLKQGGLFVFDMHDNGTVWTPFYIKM